VTRLAEPVQREISVDGERWIVRLEHGQGTHAGQVLLELRRHRGRRRSAVRFVLSDAVRRLAKLQEKTLPQLDIFLHARSQ
jgi:hypothetical protein